MEKSVQDLEAVTIRFAGDSGDGMQTSGAQFTNVSALMGNDLGTLPDYPAEIRAPAGSLAGVSGFQLHVSSHEIFTPGEDCDALVAMNPAALNVNLGMLKPNGVLIINTDNFKPRNLAMAGYEENPLENGSLDAYQVYEVEMSRLTRDAVAELGLSNKNAERCKNFFALGMTFWLYQREIQPSIDYINDKFGKKPDVARANILALEAGRNFCENTELFNTSYKIPPAKLRPGRYRNITGNTAIVLGMVAASQKSGLNLFLGSYPITPASDILHVASRYKNFGVRTVQAEDEIAAVSMAIGAAYGGSLAFTATSGPGLALKTEAIGLALIAELPLVVFDIQRAGPSTGLPTKTEQTDLLFAYYGRPGESSIPILAPRQSSDCFDIAYEASRIAVKFMTPVLVLSDLYLAFGAEPWLIPSSEDLPPFDVSFHVDPEGFQPYQRDPETLARPWAVPGTKGLQHRIGGLEKEDGTGNVTYNPDNHHKMCELRTEKVRRIQQEIPTTQIDGPKKGKLLVLGWGSTYGAIRTAVKRKQDEGRSVSHVHLRFLNPLPEDLGSILQNFEKILVPELNLGQLIRIIRDEYLISAIGFSKVRAQPFDCGDIERAIEDALQGKQP
ncbi:MAG: 2-oxoacid:acceptor oxidoreductase subunit alpha [Planctomycetota bacterium]|jgi:2-oxoglutarate ferredoxin oxidoreductase subunit alpha|nr:2-oxoacid:acceptor oxidoreductase subunit alpha [Planctomycetota bacterium]MDP7249557.1 2-oxoacid:acceptor oxidoreductase subunit alpha [Planctomycetota bacterium]